MTKALAASIHSIERNNEIIPSIPSLFAIRLQQEVEDGWGRGTCEYHSLYLGIDQDGGNDRYS